MTENLIFKLCFKYIHIFILLSEKGGQSTLVTEQDWIVRAASHKIIHVGPTRGCAVGWWYRQRRTAVRTSNVTRMTVFAKGLVLHLRARYLS